jgi:hypothetical protein
MHCFSCMGTFSFGHDFDDSRIVSLTVATSARRYRGRYVTRIWPSEETVLGTPDSSFPCRRNSHTTCSSLLNTSRHSAKTPQVRSPVSQNSALPMVYPLGALPTPNWYHVLQFLPAPLVLVPESAVTMAGATDCDGGASFGSWAVAHIPKTEIHISTRERIRRKRTLLYWCICSIELLTTPLTNWTKNAQRHSVLSPRVAGVRSWRSVYHKVLTQGSRHLGLTRELCSLGHELISQNGPLTPLEKRKVNHPSSYLRATVEPKFLLHRNRPSWHDGPGTARQLQVSVS